MPFDLDLIAEARIGRRPFDDNTGFDLALTGDFTFFVEVFLTSDLAIDLASVLALTRPFATTFFCALADLEAALDVGFLDKVLAVVFTAFFTVALFATFLATFAVEILVCFETEAAGRPDKAGFFFNSFFFFEPDFEPGLEIDFELVLAAATFAFVLLLWPLESVSLIPISFC
ncbi:MAG: hypothetical protein L0Y75_07835 [Acidobacteria bacterium]|nr:hypothetical protein [Acidobacteriota bacterium]